MFFDEGGRHYWLGKELIKRGYQVTIFCANTVHKSDKIVKINSGICREKEKEGLRFVFIKTNVYQGNGVPRVKNMLAYTINMLRLYRRYGKVNGKPDVIYASSVHPLALYAGIKIAKYYHVKSISEIRDIWPLTLIEFGKIKRNNIVSKMMFWYEKKIYENTDELVFTMEGGERYIKEWKWDIEQGGKIDIRKVHYINNGLILEDFLYYRNTFQIKDSNLEDKDVYKIVYTGTIAAANRVSLIIDIAEYLQSKNLPIKFYIWGEGDDKIRLQERVRESKINNVVFKEKVEKKYIPYITSMSNLNIFVLEECKLYQYGLSLNKLFEYIAAQKPFLIAGAKVKCRLLADNSLCTVCETSNIKEIAETIIKCFQKNKDDGFQNIELNDDILELCDFSRRTDDLIKVIERDRS